MSQTRHATRFIREQMKERKEPDYKRLFQENIEAGERAIREFWRQYLEASHGE